MFIACLLHLPIAWVVTPLGEDRTGYMDLCSKFGTEGWGCVLHGSSSLTWWGSRTLCFWQGRWPPLLGYVFNVFRGGLEVLHSSLVLVPAVGLRPRGHTSRDHGGGWLGHTSLGPPRAGSSPTRPMRKLPREFAYGARPSSPPAVCVFPSLLSLKFLLLKGGRAEYTSLGSHPHPCAIPHVGPPPVFR